MGKNTNDINDLEARQRALARLRAPSTSVRAPETIEPTDNRPEPPLLEAAPKAPTPSDSSAALARLVARAPKRPENALWAPRALYDHFSDGELADGAQGREIMASYIASRISEHTKRTMYGALQRVARLLGTEAELVPWHTLRFEHTDAIRAKLLDGSFSKPSVQITLAALKGVLRQARRAGLMSQEEFLRAVDWDRLKLQSLPVGRELPQEEINRIQEHIAGTSGAYRVFLEVVFALLLGTGLRASEACNMPPEAYDSAAKMLRLRRKGDKEDELPLGDLEAAAIEAWLVTRASFARRIAHPAMLFRVQANDWVRPSSPECNEQKLKHLCTQLAAEIGIPHFTPHDLRRTFCTRAIRESGDVFAVQAFMGHAKVETTRKYDKRQLEEHAIKRRRWNIWRPPSAPEGAVTQRSVRTILPQSPPRVVATIEQWVASGDARIDEIDLRQFAQSTRLAVYMTQSRRSDGSTASASHQRLCALSALFIESSGRPFTFDRSRCWYSGGIADLCATDGSLYVECGQMQTWHRPVLALCHKQALMYVPYGDAPIGFLFRALTDVPATALTKFLAQTTDSTEIW